MDINKLLADMQGIIASTCTSDIKEEEKIVQPVNEPIAPKSTNGPPVPEIKPLKDFPCECGDPRDAHANDGPCTILECGCDAYSPFDPTADSATVDSATAESTTKLPEPSEEALPDGFCHHICDNPECLKWWTHGEIGNCQFPDLLKQGLCQNCSTNHETFQIDLDSDFKDGKLSPTAQIKVRNDQQERCQNMNHQQLCHHITYLSKMMQELRAREMHTRRMISDLEEEALKDVPEHKREEFIQALRQGEKKARKASKPKKEKTPALVTKKSQEAALIAKLKSEGKPTEDAKMIAAFMIQTKKSQAEAEKWFNE